MSPNEETSRHFYEHPAFKGTAAVVALVAAALALIGPLSGVFDDLFPDSPPPVSWVEVVLDTSVAMEKEFDGQTMLEAAAASIGKTVKELENEGLGLRRTATSCKGRSEQLVELDSGHAEEVTEEAMSQRPRGKASIVDAIVGGLQEFKREPIANRGPASRRLLVFTAGVSQCGEEDLEEEMTEALKEADISQSSEVEVVALGRSGSDGAQPGPSANGGNEAREEEAESMVSPLSAPLEDSGLGVTVYEPESARELDELSEDIGARASRANEILEEERDNGFYEQQ